MYSHQVDSMQFHSVWKLLLFESLFSCQADLTHFTSVRTARSQREAVRVVVLVLILVVVAL